MKAILISDHAIWCALMMNGKKKVEVRKGTALYKAIQKLIDEYGYADIYVYCTKDKSDKETLRFMRGRYGCMKNYDPYGKVIFKFRCYKVEELPFSKRQKQWANNELSVGCQLTYYEFCDYLQYKTGTAIHISDLEIFDKPKELSEFRTVNKTGIPQYEFGVGTCNYKKLTKAPQSFAYIEVGE